MRVDGGGTGRLDEAAAKAAAKAAAEAAAKAAAEAARKAAAERAAAAAKKAAEQAAEKAAEHAKHHTGRLANEAKKMDMGDHPWEEKAGHAVAAAAGGVAAVTGSALYQHGKNLISAQKKIGDVRETVEKLRGAGAAAGGASKLGAALSKANSVTKVVGGVQSALNLKNSIGALKDGATKEELITASKDVLRTVGGVEAVAKLGGKSVLGKFNPVVAVAAATTDAADRVNKLKDWNQLDTKAKIANIAGLGADVADIVGAVTPPPVKFAAMGVSAGLSLVSLGAENFDKISAGAKAATEAVGHAASEAAHAVADTASKAVDAVSETAHKAVDKVKNIFHGL